MVSKSDLIKKQLGQKMTVKKIAELVNASVSWTRELLNRGLKEGLFSKEKDPNDKRRNIWSILYKYRRYTFTLRIIDTNSAGKKKHRWDVSEDTEMTIKGVVPISMNEEDIRKKLKEDLRLKSLQMLASEGILNIPESRIIIKEAEDKGISGVSLDEFTDSFDNENKVEVVFTNNIGSVYVYKDKIQKRLDEF